MPLNSARAYFEVLLNKGDFNVVEEIMASNIQFHYPLGDLDGTEAVKQYIEAVRTAFPDINFTVAEEIAEGARVAVRWHLTGTQTGNFRGQPPSNMAVDVPGITIFHLVDGKIQEMWIMFDPAKLVRP